MGVINQELWMKICFLKCSYINTTTYINKITPQEGIKVAFAISGLDTRKDAGVINNKEEEKCEWVCVCVSVCL